MALIIESALHFTAIRLIQKTDCTLIREEELSSLIARSSEIILQNVGETDFTKKIQVEKLYPKQNSANGKRADVFIDKTTLSSLIELCHEIWIECKVLRHSESRWYKIKDIIDDFRKVIKLSGGFCYSIILAASDYKKHIPPDIDQQNLFTKLLDPKSPSLIKLYDSPQNFKDEKNLMSISQNNGDLEINILRNFTSVIPLTFSNQIEKYRLYIFQLFCKERNIEGIEL